MGKLLPHKVPRSFLRGNTEEHSAWLVLTWRSVPLAVLIIVIGTRPKVHYGYDTVSATLCHRAPIGRPFRLPARLRIKEFGFCFLASLSTLWSKTGQKTLSPLQAWSSVNNELWLAELGVQSDCFANNNLDLSIDVIFCHSLQSAVASSSGKLLQKPAGSRWVPLWLLSTCTRLPLPLWPSLLPAPNPQLLEDVF